MRALTAPASLATAGLLAALLGLSAGCQGGLTDPAPLSPALDEAYFRCKVQPILTKSCAAFACHGSSNRYLRIFARNRLRYGIPDEAHRNAAMNANERAFNYDIARSFIDLGSPDDSLLLRKPLESTAGGYYHGGSTFFGKGNVFPDKLDPDYVVLSKWAHGEKGDPTCTEPGSDL